MSVSASNQAFTSPTDNLAQPPAGAQPSPVAKAAGAAGPSFAQPADRSGPVFGSAAQSSKSCFNPGPPPRPNPGPPPRPNPSLPDAYYGKQSNEVLAQQLLSRYDAFKPWYAPTLTPKHIENIAARPLTGDPQRDADTKLANVLRKRDNLLPALDRNAGTGVLDNSLSKEDISKFIRSSNPFKLQDDRQLAQNVLNNFDRLKGRGRDSIDVNRLAQLASSPLTGYASINNLILMSQQVMERSELKGSMDNVFGFLRDGKITRDDLYRLLR